MRAHRDKKRRLTLGMTAVVGAMAVALTGPGAGAAPPDDGGDEGFGNNLAMPVIWAEEGSARPALRGTGSQTSDLTANTASSTYLVIDSDSRAYYQQTENTWQAENAEAADLADLALTAEGKVPVSYVDWGDNLEVKDWGIGNTLRVETRLLQDVSAYADADPADETTPGGMTAYSMMKTSADDVTGPDEMWGVLAEKAQTEYEAAAVQAEEAFVYTDQACLTIERIDQADTIGWDPVSRTWTGSSVVNSCMGGGDGPGNYGAEVTISGGMTYGFVWLGIKNLEGEYRMTYSTSADAGVDFTDDTQLYVSEESEDDDHSEEAELQAAEEDGDDGGAPEGNVAVIDPVRDLSYIDVGLSATSGKPSRPVNLNAEAGVESATLTWDPPVVEGDSPITEYLVNGSGAGKTLPQLTVDAGSALTASYDGLEGDELYTFTVAAVNSLGAGDLATATATPSAAPAPTDSPTSGPTDSPTGGPSASPTSGPTEPVKVQKRAKRKIGLKMKTKVINEGDAVKLTVRGRVRSKHDGTWALDYGRVKLYFNPAGPEKAQLMKVVKAKKSNKFRYRTKFTVEENGRVFAKVVANKKHQGKKSRVLDVRMAQ